MDGGASSEDVEQLCVVIAECQQKLEQYEAVILDYDNQVIQLKEENQELLELLRENEQNPSSADSNSSDSHNNEVLVENAEVIECLKDELRAVLEAEEDYKQREADMHSIIAELSSQLQLANDQNARMIVKLDKANNKIARMRTTLALCDLESSLLDNSVIDEELEDDRNRSSKDKNTSVNNNSGFVGTTGGGISLGDVDYGGDMSMDAGENASASASASASGGGHDADIDGSSGDATNDAAMESNMLDESVIEPIEEEDAVSNNSSDSVIGDYDNGVDFVREDWAGVEAGVEIPWEKQGRREYSGSTSSPAAGIVQSSALSREDENAAMSTVSGDRVSKGRYLNKETDIEASSTKLVISPSKSLQSPVAATISHSPEQVPTISAGTTTGTAAGAAASTVTANATTTPVRNLLRSFSSGARSAAVSVAPAGKYDADRNNHNSISSRNSCDLDIETSRTDATVSVDSSSRLLMSARARTFTNPASVTPSRTSKSNTDTDASHRNISSHNSRSNINIPREQLILEDYSPVGSPVVTSRTRASISRNARNPTGPMLASCGQNNDLSAGSLSNGHNTDPMDPIDSGSDVRARDQSPSQRWQPLVQHLTTSSSSALRTPYTAANCAVTTSATNNTPKPSNIDFVNRYPPRPPASAFASASRRRPAAESANAVKANCDRWTTCSHDEDDQDFLLSTTVGVSACPAVSLTNYVPPAQQNNSLFNPNSFSSDEVVPFIED